MTASSTARNDVGLSTEEMSDQDLRRLFKSVDADGRCGHVVHLGAIFAAVNTFRSNKVPASAARGTPQAPYGGA